MITPVRGQWLTVLAILTTVATALLAGGLLCKALICS